MKYAVFCLLLVVAAMAQKRSVEDDFSLFEDFKATYNRQYSPSESSKRFDCFRTNLDLIDQRNARATSERHGVNQFTDLCPEEFAKYFLGYKADNRTRKAAPAKVQKPEGAIVDWRTKGVVTPIKNQGMCGSCWSFSATGNMEGQWAIAKGQLVGLSEEELVQCSHNDDFGCQGGLMDNAFEWVVSNGGINSENNYPYTSGTGITGTCNTALASQSVVQISGHTDLPNSEDSMASWVMANGPLSVAVYALSWQTYSGGIMQNCGGTQLDHGVLVVGYDTTYSIPYWIIKNSWGTSWGENGYIRLAYGSNQCGINQDPCSCTV